jgi:tetratricopeptide (TPR) repeat protein
MALGPVDSERRILPRLSPSRRAMGNGELASASNRSTPIEDDPFFAERVRLWRTDRDIGVGAELVAMGQAHSKEPSVLDAAREVALVEQLRSTPIGRAARELLGLPVDTAEEVQPQRHSGPLNIAAIRAAAASARRHAFMYPHHSFAWSDLGRYYAVLGENAKAQRAFDIALSLAPNNRFLLRNAARLHVHFGQKDRALRLLRDSDATRYDPWLMSAEVAVSQSAGTSSKMASRAFRELERADWSPHSTSELRGSLATLLLNDGSVSKARKSFRQSLKDPTENAVAQAQWATDKTSGLVVPADALAVPQNFETHALRARSLGNWSGAIQACWHWANYEPTSSRPMSLGSHVAALALDGQSALEFAERGLAIDQDSAMFMNNKAVGLALLMRPDEAVQAIREALTKKDRSPGQHIFLLATMGLIFFRAGEPESGRQFYERAIEMARPPIDPSIQSYALWHLAREEAAYKSSTLDATVERAREASKPWKNSSEVQLFEKSVAALRKSDPLPVGMLTAREKQNEIALQLSEFARQQDERL